MANDEYDVSPAPPPHLLFCPDAVLTLDLPCSFFSRVTLISKHPLLQRPLLAMQANAAFPQLC